MNIMKTLQYMKPDIKLSVWPDSSGLDDENTKNSITMDDGQVIIYNETEEFRPTKAEILAVDQSLVESYWTQRDEEEKTQTQEQLQNQLIDIYNQIQILKDKTT